MTWIVAYVLSIPGFAGLSLSMSKYQRDVFGSKQSALRSRLYRITGSLLTAGGALWCLSRHEFGYALVVWCGVLTAAALTIIATITLRPAWLRFLCWLPRGFG